MDGALRRWMYAAAAYNALWGLGVVLFAGPVAWKCVGMLVACYAPGYWWAARRPLPEIVAIGLLGKILGPIGFVWAAATGRLPLAFGFVILANDVVWWPAFVAYLRHCWGAARRSQGQDGRTPVTDAPATRSG
jgi:small multidrug resistance pump